MELLGDVFLVWVDAYRWSFHRILDLDLTFFLFEGHVSFYFHCSIVWIFFVMVMDKMFKLMEVSNML